MSCYPGADVPLLSYFILVKAGLFISVVGADPGKTAVARRWRRSEQAYKRIVPFFHLVLQSLFYYLIGSCEQVGGNVDASRGR